MSNFDRLDPLVQHHIVNTLGWRELRPLQEASIEPVLRRDNCLLLAPTAGGKTESALFPLLSRMCSERWPAPGLIYICPLKALINNLGERLDRYTRMLGRRSAIWHGDVGQAERSQARQDPPDILITTPESLEAMLISTNSEMRQHLQQVQAVVVDEIHAFAGDDRGWHLLCVLERLCARTGTDIQRVGLSATVGNPQGLLKWLAGQSRRPISVVEVNPGSGGAAEVTLDFVGSLENAAVVIARLHQGQKRLVFCDSRSRVEKLAGLLRSAGVDAFVSHSSLSSEERQRAETAFARQENCTIVATSTLELGIDVGDLDRVIQIDAPTRVSSFLQRLGRTGRRDGRLRNCLFLCTSERALLRAAALLELWRKSYVEPIVPPPRPYHIFAQQALALCLERSGVGRADLLRQLSSLMPLADICEADLTIILDHMMANGLMAMDGGLCFVGGKGEEVLGRRNFLDLVSVFTSAPFLTVSDGRQDLGQVDQNLFFSPEPLTGRLLSLGGRGWRIERVNWEEKRVYVTASDALGKTSWLGMSQGLSLVMGHAVREVLLDGNVPPWWSQRTRERMGELRQKTCSLRAGHTILLNQGNERIGWFTFAGLARNQALGEIFTHFGTAPEESDDLAVWFSASASSETLMRLITHAQATSLAPLLGANEEAEKALKFAICLPPALRTQEIVARRCLEAELNAVVNEPCLVVNSREDWTIR